MKRELQQKEQDDGSKDGRGARTSNRSESSRLEVAEAGKVGIVSRHGKNAVHNNTKITNSRQEVKEGKFAAREARSSLRKSTKPNKLNLIRIQYKAIRKHQTVQTSGESVIAASESKLHMHMQGHEQKYVFKPYSDGEFRNTQIKTGPGMSTVQRRYKSGPKPQPRGTPSLTTIQGVLQCHQK